MKTYRVLFRGLCFLFLLFILNGCFSAIALLPTAIQVAGEAAASIEDCDIDAAVSPECTKEDFAKIKRIALVFNRMEGVYGGDMAGAVVDSLALELMKLGFDVVEHSKALEQADSTSEGFIRLAKVLRVDAIVTGTVTSSTAMSMGLLFSESKTSTRIQSASLKIIGGKTGKTMMIVTVNYRKGQKPNDAAKSIAVILKQKMEDPSV